MKKTPAKPRTRTAGAGKMNGRSPATVQKKVFVSFDYDQDKALKDLFIGQAHNKHCPFVVIDGSLQEAGPEDGWEKKARSRIQQADLMIVLVGANTHRAAGVLKEVNLARGLDKRVVQLIGYKHGRHPRIQGGGRLYQWTWENLQKILR